MKKTIIVMAIAFLTLFGKAYAEMAYGISAAITKIDASGTETEGGEQTSESVDNLVVVPSIFVEYDMGGYSLGLDYIPLKADVSDKTRKRTDTETSVTGTATTTSTSRTQSAQAQLENHLTLYANYNLSDELFFKAGVAMVTLNTDESLGTGSKYGNEDIFGYVIGAGVSGGSQRVELVYTDYEDISISSSVARTGVTTNNKIEADLDTLSLKYSFVF